VSGAIQQGPSRDADQHSAHPIENGKPQVEAPPRLGSSFRAGAQVLDPESRLGLVQEVAIEVLEEPWEERVALRRFEPLQLGGCELDGPLTVGCRKIGEGLVLGRGRRGLPALGVGADLLRDPAQVAFVSLQLGQGPGAPGPEGLADAIEQPDLGLPGGAVLPGFREHAVDLISKVDPGSLCAAAQDVLQVHVARAQRRVG
jgi:hypothetical protein